MNHHLRPKLSDSNETSIFAETDYRGVHTPFGVKRKDRRSHMWLLGKTGTGKSTTLENLMRDDLKKGFGFALLDPHGDLVERVKKVTPWSRQDDIIDFDAPNSSQKYGFNPLKGIPPKYQPLAASGMVQVFKHLWKDSWGARTEHILRNLILTMLEYPNANLSDMLKLLSDKDFRKTVLTHITNEQVRLFWTDEFEKYSYRFKSFAAAPIQNKVGAFLSHPQIKTILTEPEGSISFRKVIDEGKILLVNLSKGKLGEDMANLLGSLIISRFDLAALSRSNISEDERNDYTLYLDEFHNFTTHSLVFMLSELRKYRLSLVLANQYISQLLPEIRDAIIGNAGTIISFRIGAKDAEYLAREMSLDLKPGDFIDLPNFRIYLRMMIDGKPSKPFNARTLPPSKTD